MKSFSFVSVLSSAILVTSFANAADAERHQPASEMFRIAGHTSAIVVAEASTVKTRQPGGEKSIIIVSGKQSTRGWIGSRGSKVMLNPQPLPPKASEIH